MHHKKIIDIDSIIDPDSQRSDLVTFETLERPAEFKSSYHQTREKREQENAEQKEDHEAEEAQEDRDTQIDESMKTHDILNVLQVSEQSDQMYGKGLASKRPNKDRNAKL